MNLRIAKLSDLQDLSSLWWEMQSGHFKYDNFFYGTKFELEAKELSKEYFKYSLKKENHIVVVLVHDDRVIGFIHCEIVKRPPIFKEEKEAILLEVIVTEHFQGRGLFSKMFALLKQQFKMRDVHICTLSVEKENKYGLKAYEKSGFKERQKKMILYLP
ncbi:MAG: GNAT family N-acetyltransferase [Candidatus Helarchaeota archaeon]|nr:GNAT family N-acetyltransferase [Candidatus Helarchaeota archaeon]